MCCVRFKKGLHKKKLICAPNQHANFQVRQNELPCMHGNHISPSPLMETKTISGIHGNLKMMLLHVCLEKLPPSSLWLKNLEKKMCLASNFSELLGCNFSKPSHHPTIPEGQAHPKTRLAKRGKSCGLGPKSGEMDFIRGAHLHMCFAPLNPLFKKYCQKKYVYIYNIYILSILYIYIYIFIYYQYYILYIIYYILYIICYILYIIYYILYIIYYILYIIYYIIYIYNIIHIYILYIIYIYYILVIVYE